MYKLKSIPEDFIVEEIIDFPISEKGAYSIFLLEKRGYDTEKAIRTISEYLDVPRKNFGYAGSKDRHAITRQYISLYGKIRECSLKDLKLTLFGYRDSPISLGDLRGNSFSIVARNISKIQKITGKKVEFINYFDDQRFGRHNAEIGLNIIKRDFEKAARLIDFPATIAHLKDNPKDFVGAIMRVPRKITMLYMHSLQSLLWNEAASKYVESKASEGKKCRKICYSQGELAMPEKKIPSIEIPLISFDSEAGFPEIEKIYSHVLKEKGITKRDFIIRSMPEMTPTGGTRELVAEAKNLIIGNPEEDELNKGMKKIKISFTLGKGSYATMLIKKIFSS